MSYPHCETCRFWGDSEEVDEEFRTCTAVVHNINIGPRHGPWPLKIDESERADRDALKAVVLDASDCFAALLPRRDFGCVLHEARPGGEPR